MKKTILASLFILSLTCAHAALPEPKDAANFSCVKTDSKTSKQLRSMIEDQDNDIVVLNSIQSITASIGYDWVSTENLVNCSNDNSEGVDFELLRKYTINGLYRSML